MCLIDATRVTSISAMHTASSSSLKTRPPSQASPQLHQRTRHLVAHGRMALVVVHRRSSGSVVTASTSGASRLGGCGGGSGGATAGSSVGALGAETETGLEGGARCCAGGAGSAAG